MAAARTTLAALGAVTDDGTVTDRGRAIARIGADPRLARALLDGAALVGARRAAEIVAMISEDVRVRDGDLVAALRSLRRGGPEAGSWGAPRPAAAGRPARRPPAPRTGSTGLPDDLAVGLVVALAHPDRIARLRPGSSAYLMASGTGAVLPAGASSLAGLPWLAVADADRRPGQRDATVRSAAPLDRGPGAGGGPGAVARGGAGPLVRRAGGRRAEDPPRRDRAGVEHAREPGSRAGGRRGARGAAARGARPRCRGPTRPPPCVGGWPSCTGRWGSRGRTCRTRR